MPKPTFIRWQEVKHMPRRRIPAKVKETLKKGVSIGQLYRATMKMVDFQNAKYVKPFKVEKLVDKQGRNVYRAFTHTNDPRYPPERDHAVTIRPRDANYKGKITECPAVIIDCSCVTGDMRVLTDKGWRTVKELCAPLADEYPINYVVDGKTYRGSNTFYTGKKPVYSIKMSNGFTLKATGDHKVMVYKGRKVKRYHVNVGRPDQKGAANGNASNWQFTKGKIVKIIEDLKGWCKEHSYGYSGVHSAIRGNRLYKGWSIKKSVKIKEPTVPRKREFTDVWTRKYEWVQIRDLKTGDRLIPPTESFKLKKIRRKDSRLGYLFGMIMGDGSIYNRDNSKPFIDLHKEDSEYILSKLRRYGYVSSYKRVPAPERALGYYINVNFNRDVRLSFVEHRYRNKKSVSITSKSMLLGYLAGLIDSDGSLSGGKYHKEGQGIQVCGGYFYLSQLMGKLIEYGFTGNSLVLLREKGTITNLGAATRDMYGLYLCNNTCRIIRRYVKLSPTRTPSISTDKRLDRLPVVKVLEIKKLGKEKVYDLTVPDLGHFICEGVKISNCARHTFMHEYADAIHGDGLIWRGNGEPPNVTNPKRRIGSCKHGLSLMKWLIQRRM